MDPLQLRRGFFHLKIFGVFIINIYKMAKIIRLTESDLTRLVKKIVKEQMEMEDPSEDYFRIIDIVANHAMEEEGDLDEVERCITEIYKIMNDANSDDELSDDQVDEIFNYAEEVIEQLESMF